MKELYCNRHSGYSSCSCPLFPWILKLHPQVKNMFTHLHPHPRSFSGHSLLSSVWVHLLSWPLPFSLEHNVSSISFPVLFFVSHNLNSSSHDKYQPHCNGNMKCIHIWENKAFTPFPRCPTVHHVSWVNRVCLHQPVVSNSVTTWLCAHTRDTLDKSRNRWWGFVWMSEADLHVLILFLAKYLHGQQMKS